MRRRSVFSPEKIALTLSASYGPPAPGATKCCFGLCETGLEEVEGGGTVDPNFIQSATQPDPVNQPGKYELLLDRPISGEYWTRIQWLGDESAVWYASLPGDVDADGAVCDGESVSDITALLACLNNPGSCTNYRADINHSGAQNAQDITTLINVMIGANRVIRVVGAHHS